MINVITVNILDIRHVGKELKWCPNIERLDGVKNMIFEQVK